MMMESLKNVFEKLEPQTREDVTTPQKKKSSFQKEVFSIIEKYVGENHVRAISIEIPKMCGDHETGIFLSQLIYWADKGKSPWGWIYKSDKDWQDELLLSNYSIRKARNKLKRMGILETKLKRANGSPTTHYRINKKAFWDRLKNTLSNSRKQKSESLQSKFPSCENAETITENTTEITSQSTTKNTEAHEGVLPRQARTYSLSRPVSFKDFCNQHEVDAEAKEVIQHFLTKYKRHMGDEHPKLKPEQWQDVVDSLFLVWEVCGGGEDVDSEQLRKMTNKYFETKFEPGCNYSILHFNSGGVKAKRFYEVCL